MKKKIFLILTFLFIVSIPFVSAVEDTGDTGFYEEELVAEEVIALLEEGRGDELTSEQIAEYIELIDDITQLDQYELNKYVQDLYSCEIIIENAVSGAQIKEDGFLQNGPFGSRINMIDLPTGAEIYLETDGSITIYASKNTEQKTLDYEMLYKKNSVYGEERPPITFITVEQEYTFYDDTVLKEGSTLIINQDGSLSLVGDMTYNGLEISGYEDSLLIIDTMQEYINQDEFDSYIASAKSTSKSGILILTEKQIYTKDLGRVIVSENQGYGVMEDQGLIFMSYEEGGIFYDTRSDTPKLVMSGLSTVFNGLRVFEGTNDGHFYSFRGGWKWKEGEWKKEYQNKIEIEKKKIMEYNNKLFELYGQKVTETLDMDVEYYTQKREESGSSIFEKIEEYTLRAEELEFLETPDLYVANYFFDEPYQETLKTKKKRALIVWTHGTDDKEDFEAVVEQKKNDLLEHGYEEDEINVQHFEGYSDLIDAMDNNNELTYMEIVGHGWMYKEEGGTIGTFNSYSNKEDHIRVTEINEYFDYREENIKRGLAKPLFSEEVAVCVISTCHSAASDSIYDVEKGVVWYATEDELDSMAQGIKKKVGEDVTVYGTIGPLYIARDKKGASTFVPVLDATFALEGTFQPSAELQYTQNLPYYEVSEEGPIIYK